MYNRVKIIEHSEKKNIVCVDSNLVKNNDSLLVEYHQKVDVGLEDIKFNRIISKEELEKEMLDWDNE